MKKFLGMLLSLMMIVGATAAMAEFDYTQDITVVSREEGSARARVHRAAGRGKGG